MYNKFECIMIYYITVILGINSYIVTQDLISKHSVWLEILLYVFLFLPALIVMIIGCIWTCQKCCCSRLIWKKLTTQQKGIKLSVTTPALEDQQLVETSETFNADPPDHVLTSDRFAQHIGYGTM